MNAHTWIGYMEHASPDRLNEFTANTGKGGFTIFGAMTGLQGLPWCATFVHAVVSDPDTLGRPHPGCRVLQRRMRHKGLWRDAATYLPRPGDLCFCSNAGTDRVDHVGIVERVDGSTVTTIDGNSVDPTGVFRPEEGGAVSRRTRQLNDPVIVGYGAIGGNYYEP